MNQRSSRSRDKNPEVGSVQKIHHAPAPIQAVGLGNFTLGQPIPILSGGDAQRSFHAVDPAALAATPAAASSARAARQLVRTRRWRQPARGRTPQGP